MTISHVERLATAEPKIASSLPFPTTTFTGRKSDLERGCQLLEAETLLVVLGVGGVGKTEYVLKLVDQMRSESADPLCSYHSLRVPAQLDFKQFLARLLARLRTVTPSSWRAQLQSSVETMIRELCWFLEAAPHLIFIDDAHNLDRELLAELNVAISRNVRRSRIIEASLSELHLVGSASAAVIRLEPLGKVDSAQLTKRLAHKMGIAPPDSDCIYRKTFGSPFYIERELVETGEQTLLASDSLTRTISCLDSEPVELLLTIIKAAGRLRRGAAFSSDALATLESLLLVGHQGELLTTHDLVREAVLRVASPAAHKRAAMSAAKALAEAEVPEDVLAAIAMLSENEEHEQVWFLAQAHHRQIVDAARDAELLGPLDAARLALPEQATEIDLIRTRICMRAREYRSASELLAQIEPISGGPEFDRQRLLGGLAILGARVDDGARRFEDAVVCASSDRQRVHGKCLAAVAVAMSADFERAHRELAAAKEIVAKIDKDGTYAVLCETAVLVLEGRFADAYEVAVRLLDQAPDRFYPAFAINAIISAVETEQLDEAHAILDKTFRESPPVHMVVKSLCEGIIASGSGDLLAARKALVDSFHWFRGCGDFLNACIAAYKGGEVLLALGELEEAREMMDIVGSLTVSAGAHVFSAYCLATQSRIAMQLDGPGVARELAAQALALPSLPKSAEVRARCALAVALANLEEHEMADKELDVAEALALETASPRRRLVKRTRVECALARGDFDGAIDLGQAIALEYGRLGDQYHESMVGLWVATAYTCRAAPGDIALANAIIRDFEERKNKALNALSSRASLLEAALLIREESHDSAREVLLQALSDHGIHRQDMLACELRVALGSERCLELSPAARATLGRLRLIALHRLELVECGGRRSLVRKPPALEDGWELIVDLDSGTITAPKATEIAARPVMCRLLAALIEEPARIVNAERLYRHVWNSAEYHTIRDGNKLYVGISRLRKLLRKVSGNRVAIQTMTDGWRLSDGVMACTIRTV